MFDYSFNILTVHQYFKMLTTNDFSFSCWANEWWEMVMVQQQSVTGRVWVLLMPEVHLHFYPSVIVFILWDCSSSVLFFISLAKLIVTKTKINQIYIFVHMSNTKRSFWSLFFIQRFIHSFMQRGTVVQFL